MFQKLTQVLHSPSFWQQLKQHFFAIGIVMRYRWCKGYPGGRGQPRSVLLPKRHSPGYSYVPKAQERSVQTLEVSCSCLADVHVQQLSVTLTLSLQTILVQVCCWLHVLVPLHLSAAQPDPDRLQKNSDCLCEALKLPDRKEVRCKQSTHHPSGWHGCAGRGRNCRQSG